MDQNKNSFDVCIEVDRSYRDHRYFIYKLERGSKMWFTSQGKLNRYENSKSYVSSWEQARVIVNKIFAGEIK